MTDCKGSGCARSAVEPSLGVVAVHAIDAVTGELAARREQARWFLERWSGLVTTATGLLQTVIAAEYGGKTSFVEETLKKLPAEAQMRLEMFLAAEQAAGTQGAAEARDALMLFFADLWARKPTP